MFVGVVVVKSSENQLRTLYIRYQVHTPTLYYGSIIYATYKTFTPSVIK